MQIHARVSNVAAGVELGPGSVITADEVSIAGGVRIGPNVQITCDRLILGANAKIGANTTMLAPEIELGEGSSIGSNTSAEMNEYFRIGRFSVVGNNVAIAGQGMRAGEFLWLKDNVVVGGGGARGPRSYLLIGDHTSVFDGCYINLSETVTLGNGSALSTDVCLLTHAAWQPSMMGYPTKFAPITIGDYVVVYLKSSVMPGVTIHDYSTVGACSLVTRDIPPHTLAAGVPAEIKGEPGSYPRPMTRDKKERLAVDIIEDYLTTLPSKGLEVVSKEGRYVARWNDSDVAIDIVKRDELGIAFGDVYFNLDAATVEGSLSPFAEDFRDYLRRRAIRIFTDKPFRTLPLKNLERLQRMRAR
ncbi:MAG TPA: hypothetical protein VEK11_00525 [Thermoanaerobaculia bacterium]|nr:hypothetical protein [Thermoanaerobaculia bacterium]